MSSSQTSIPKGTRDFGPVEMAGRNHIFSVIKNIFRTYGYQPLETPAMETLSTLLGKYGEEGDKLLFRILNSGDFLSKVSERDLLEKNHAALFHGITEKGLRYDLTVPFARYVVQHQNEITFPFKRFQIQPVWRADRPQKGRYREFYQCDVDVIGSRSLLSEVELVQIMDDVFIGLDISVIIRINNRKILTGLVEAMGQSARFTEITVIIDKLEKTGAGRMFEELSGIGVSAEGLGKLKQYLELESGIKGKLEFLGSLLKDTPAGLQGVAEIETVMEYLDELEIRSEIIFDLSLTRGLNYYTGAIFEVVAENVKMGSLCGGGRYDDLTGVFGLKDVSGVGVSFGADRIYDVLKQTDRFSDLAKSSTRIMFVNFGKTEEKYCLKLLEKVRKSGISAELYPDQVRIKKQLSYAHAKNIPFVALIGSTEMQTHKLTLKIMASGEQKILDLNELIEFISES